MNLSTDKLPKNKVGAILWSKIPGFTRWFVNVAPTLTNKELLVAVKQMYKVDIKYDIVTSLRKRHNCQMSVDTRKRSFDDRDNSCGESKSTQSADEKLEQDLLRKQVHRLTSRQLFYEVISQKILAAISNIPPLPALKKPPTVIIKRGLEEEEMVLLVSDVQAGLLVDSKESGGLGSFNTDMLLKYIEALQTSVLRIKQYHATVKTLNIFWLGDIVEGEEIYGGQLREIDMNVIQQVMFCWERFAHFMNEFASEFMQVKCWGVVGNHGRIGRKGEHSPMSNFDYLLYKMWEERLKTKKNIQWKVSESWWDIASIQGWKFLLVHGDDTGQSFAGIPFYAVNRHKSRYREMFKSVLDEQMDFDYMTIGHHSEIAEFKNILLNGSWPGGTEFSIKRLQLADVPSQKLFGVHKEHGVTWSRNIHLRPLKISK